MSRKLTSQKLQNLAAGIIARRSFDASTSTLLGRLKWPSSNEFIAKQTVAVVYKFIAIFEPSFSSTYSLQLFMGSSILCYYFT